MPLALFTICLVALALGLVGRALSRRRRAFGAAWAAGIVALGAWQLADLRDPIAWLLLMSPGASATLDAVLLGYLAALALTLWPVFARRRAAA